MTENHAGSTSGSRPSTERLTNPMASDYGASQQGGAPTDAAPGSRAPSGGQVGRGPTAKKPKSDKRVFGAWGLILGIASLIIGPLLFGLLSVGGIVFSIVALVRESRSKGLAIWGIVLSVLGLLWLVVFWVLLIVFGAWLWIDVNILNPYATGAPTVHS